VLRHPHRVEPPWLRRLHADVLRMGAKVEAMLDASLAAFASLDRRTAEATIGADGHVDALELKIDGDCITTLARRQPVASDLRFVTGVLKAVTHLERIGDLCESIARHVVVLSADRWRPRCGVLDRMGEVARGMLKEALDAFADHDAERALRVMARDEVLDAHYAQFFPQLLVDVEDDPSRIPTLTQLLSIGKDLERIGDLATNLAEVVVFATRGERATAGRRASRRSSDAN
jgi:phosphate transport system protein